MPVISASKKLFNINLTILRLPVTMQARPLQKQFHEDIIALHARTFSPEKPNQKKHQRVGGINCIGRVYAKIPR